MALRVSPKPKKGKVGPSAGRLTAQQELFVEAIASNTLTAKEAALKAGCPEKSAASTACKWLDSDKFPHIAIAIRNKQELRRNTSDVDAKRIIQELARIGFFDPRRLLNPDGKGVMALKDMPDDIAAVIKDINISYGETVDGDGNFHVLKNIRLTFHDKLSALSQLSNMLGLGNGGATTIINNNTTNQLVLKFDDLYKKQKEMAALPAADPVEQLIKAELDGTTTVEVPLPQEELKTVDSND